VLSDIKEANPDRALCRTNRGKQLMKENIKMKKEQLSFTEKRYTQLMAEYKATDKEDKKLRKEEKAL